MAFTILKREIIFQFHVVVYDRADSAFACSKPDEYDWDQILEDTDIFFFSGVTPAVSESVKETVLDALRCCQKKGN